MTELVTFGETMLRLSPPRGERLETTSDLAVQAGERREQRRSRGCAARHRCLLALETPRLAARSADRERASEPRGSTGDCVDGSGRESVGDLLPRTRRFPTGTNVIYDRADAAITTVKPDELPTNAVEKAEWFHTTGITPALSEAAAETTTALLQRAGDAGTTRSFDLNYRSKLWDPQTARAAYEDLFEHIDTLFVSST